MPSSDLSCYLNTCMQTYIQSKQKRLYIKNKNDFLKTTFLKINLNKMPKLQLTAFLGGGLDMVVHAFNSGI